MDETRNPIEAGLGWACKEATGFVGSEAVAAARADGTAEKLVAFVVTGPGIARQGNPVAGAASSPAAPCRRASASASAWPTSRPADASPAPPSRSTCAARPAHAEVRPKPLYSKETDRWPTTPTT